MDLVAIGVDAMPELAEGDWVALDYDLPAASVASGMSQYELRSEEHTSELQSLMRISYAVFCLKKKKTLKKIHIPTIYTIYNKEQDIKNESTDEILYELITMRTSTN